MKINKRSKNKMKDKEKYASKEKAKDINKQTNKNCMVASVFSKRCESYMM